jgi:hypothetical protein
MACAFRAWLGLLAALLAAPALAAPLEAYGKLPSIEAGAVSAGGAELALVVTNGEERRLVVKDMVTGQFLFIASMGQTKCATSAGPATST